MFTLWLILVTAAVAPRGQAGRNQFAIIHVYSKLRTTQKPMDESLGWREWKRS